MHGLVDKVMLSRTGMTRRVDRIEAAGMLRREPVPGDRRGAYAAITDDGGEMRPGAGGPSVPAPRAAHALIYSAPHLTGDAKIRFPGETDEYRRARERLLEAEIELRRATEDAVAARRALPAGTPLPEDYPFEEEGGAVQLSDLFSEGRDTLILYSFTYGPEMERACPSCTSILDSLDGPRRT